MLRRLRPIAKALRGNNATAGRWDPRFAPNLAALYLPGVGQTLATGCSAWADQSGNGRNLAQGTGANQPLINSDGSLTFDGTNDTMRVAFTLVQPTVVTLLLKPESWTLGDLIFDAYSNVASNLSQLIQFNTASPNIQAYAGTFSGNFTGPAVGTKAVVQVVFNGASSSIQMNNGTALTGNFGAGNMDGITLASAALQNAGWGNITFYGVSIRSASDATINALDRKFWMQKGNLA